MHFRAVDLLLIFVGGQSLIQLLGPLHEAAGERNFFIQSANGTPKSGMQSLILSLRNNVGRKGIRFVLRHVAKRKSFRPRYDLATRLKIRRHSWGWILAQSQKSSRDVLVREQKVGMHLLQSMPRHVMKGRIGGVLDDDATTFFSDREESISAVIQISRQQNADHRGSEGCGG